MNTNVIYNTIGKTYDTTRKPDAEIVAIITQHLVTQANGRYLDIGCGSGNYMGALAKNGVNIVGIDISDAMLTKAKHKFPQLHFQQGDVHNLPFQAAVFDGAIMMLVTHHFQDVKKAYQEAFRVIKQGRLVIFTSTPQQMQSYWLNYYFPNMMQNANKTMAEFDEIKTILEQAGFNKVQQLPFFVTNQLQDWFLQAGKYRPDIYLDAKVRQGMSAFQLLIDPISLQSGLEKLEHDIQTGTINSIIHKYESHLGDYSFIVSEKS